MNTVELIKKLKAAEKTLSLLSSFAHCTANIEFHGFYWRLVIEYGDGSEYSREFDSLEDAADYADAMASGAAIAAGIEL